MKSDPTLEELRNFIKVKFACILEEGSIKYDGDVAIHWFASEYHSGQWSNLYSALCGVQYNPGRMINNVTDEEETVCMIFNALLEHYDGDNNPEFVYDTETGEQF